MRAKKSAAKKTTKRAARTTGPTGRPQVSEDVLRLMIENQRRTIDGLLEGRNMLLRDLDDLRKQLHDARYAHAKDKARLDALQWALVLAQESGKASVDALDWATHGQAKGKVADSILRGESATVTLERS